MDAVVGTVVPPADVTVVAADLETELALAVVVPGVAAAPVAVGTVVAPAAEAGGVGLVVGRSFLLCLHSNYRRMNIDEWMAPCGSFITAR